MTAPRTQLQPGARLGPYEVLGLLGEGGMGSVFRARDTRLDREVAVKVLPDQLAADATLLKRFEQESKVLAGLNHPNVLAVFDVGESEGRHFLVTELLVGTTLEQLMLTSSRTMGEVAATAVALARGLAAIHGRGVIHRDLKPSNVFITSDGLLKLIDFGLARSESGDNLTKSGSFMGTPGYMGPEQLRGAPIDARADQFAFGAVLYEMLTGHLAFDGASPMDRAMAAISKEPPDLEALCAGPQGALFQVVRRCVEKAPERRYPDMGAVVLALGVPSGDSTAPITAHPAFAATLHTPVGDSAHDTLVKRATPALPAQLPMPATSISPPAAARSRWPGWAAAALALLLGGGAGLWALRRPAAAQGGSMVHRGGVLRLSAIEGVSSFDLSALLLTLNRWSLGMMLEPLARLTAQGDIEAVVVERWDVRDERRTLELFLRPGLRFHDHPCFAGGKGRVADGADLVYSLAQALRLGLLDLPVVGRGSTGTPSGLEVTARGAVVHLEKADAFLEAKLVMVMLIPRELEGCEDLHNLKRPVGTGPFMLAQPPDAQSIHLTRFDGYWRKGDDGQALPYLDGVVLEHVIDPQTALTRLSAHELDLMYLLANGFPLALERGLPLRLQERFQARGLKAAPLTSEGHPTIFGLVVHTPRAGALGTPELRRAALLALDRKALAEVEPLLTPTARYFLPFTLGRDPSLPENVYDPAAAAKLVSAAGTLPALRLGIVREAAPFAEPIKAQLEKVGFKVQLLQVDRAGLETAMANHTVDASVQYYFGTMRGEEPYPWVRVFTGVEHSSGFDTSAVDALMGELTAAPDLKARAAIYDRIEKQALADLPIIPIGFLKPEASPMVAVTSSSLRGLTNPVTGQLTQPGYFLNPAWLWLEPEPQP